MPCAGRPARPRLIERYRRVPADHRRDAAARPSARASRRSSAPPRSGAAHRAAEPAPQGRGPEPDRLVQGPGHGRRRRQGRRGRARRRSSAPRPATPRPRRRPTARRPGIEVIVVLPKGQIAAGKLLQALMAGARVVAIDGNFDQALRDRARARRAGRPPGDARQLGQPVPPRGPEDRRVRDLRRPRAGAGRAGHPGRQRRQHQRLLGGLPRLRRPPASSRRTPADVGLPGGRRRAARRRPPGRAPGDGRDGHPDRRPGLVGAGARRPRRLGRPDRAP